jgi:hypothetical protein
MRFNPFVVVLAGVVLTASSAVAAPSAGKVKPSPLGAGCKPKVMVVLKGTLMGAPLSVDVTSSNRWGRAYVPGSASTSIAVDPTTKVRRQNKKDITDLVNGDRVLVQAKVCKAALANDATPALTASKVIAHPANTS